MDNLLDNALRHTPPGGRVAVTAGIAAAATEVRPAVPTGAGPQRAAQPAARAIVLAVED